MIDSIIQKTCLVCNQIIPITNYHKNKAIKDGFRNQCKSCVKDKQRIYESNLRQRKQFPVLKEKFCPNCKITKTVSFFRKDLGRKDGFQSNCKICVDKWHNTPENKSKHSKNALIRWHNKTPIEKYSANLKRFFNMSIDDYVKMFEFQKGKCGICKTEHKPFGLVVDHCHKTGKVRGLLCSKCNSAIGMLGDDFKDVKRACDYLKGK